MRRILLVLALAVPLALVDRPHSTDPPHEAEWLRAGDATVRALRTGTGDTTLVLIHGFSESLFSWRAVIDPLATRFRILAFDLPGFGGSTKPAGPYTLDAMTGRLADLIDRETSGPVVLVGHSMGGELAAELAIRDPDRFLAVVLIAPAGWDVGLGGIADTMSAAKARALSWYLSTRAFILPEHDPAWLGEPDSALSYTLMGDSAYRASTAAVLEDFDFRALRERLPSLTRPVLLIWGTLDPVIPFVLADSLRSALPCATLHTLSGAFHRPQVEIPDTVTSLIAGFAANPSCP